MLRVAPVRRFRRAAGLEDVLEPGRHALVDGLALGQIGDRPGVGALDRLRLAGGKHGADVAAGGDGDGGVHVERAAHPDGGNRRFHDVELGRGGRRARRTRDQHGGQGHHAAKKRHALHFANHSDRSARGPEPPAEVVPGELAQEPRRQRQHERQYDTELPEHNCVDGDDDGAGHAARQQALPLRPEAPAHQEAERRHPRQRQPQRHRVGLQLADAAAIDHLRRDVGVDRHAVHLLVGAVGERRQVRVDLAQGAAHEHDLVLEALAHDLGQGIVGRAAAASRRLW